MISSLAHMLANIRALKVVASTRKDQNEKNTVLLVKTWLCTISLVSTVGLVGFFMEHRILCNNLGKCLQNKNTFSFTYFWFNMRVTYRLYWRIELNRIMFRSFQQICILRIHHSNCKYGFPLHDNLRLPNRTISDSQRSETISNNQQRVETWLNIMCTCVATHY